MDRITEFQEEHPSLESYWRSIILFGRNVASYKFALAEALTELVSSGKSSVTLNELAEPYSKHLCERLKTASRQATSNSSKFIQSCREYNAGKITYDQLIATTVKLGFNNVIDAFHHVNGGILPVKFYEKDYSGSFKRIDMLPLWWQFYFLLSLIGGAYQNSFCYSPFSFMRTLSQYSLMILYME